MKNTETSLKLTLAALLVIILSVFLFTLTKPSIKCGELCLGSLKIKGTDITGVVTYNGNQIKNATVDVLLNGEYTDAARILGNMSISAPLRFGQNALALSYKNQHATVYFWYFNGYLGFLVVPISICVLLLLMQLSKIMGMRFTVTFYEDGIHGTQQEQITLLNEAIKLASEKCAHKTMIKDLPITASEFVAEVCLLNWLERPPNWYGYEQAMAAAAAEYGWVYLDGMLLKTSDVRAVAIRRIYDSAVYNGNYTLNKIKSASRFLSINRILVGDVMYTDITKAITSWGKSRILCNGYELANVFLESEIETAGLILLRLCGKLEIIVL